MTDTSSRSKVLPFILAGVLAAAAGAWWFQHAAMPAAPAAKSGDPLPANFWSQSFDTLDGKTLQLSNYKGKPLILNFWASWCPPCVKEMPDIDRFHQDMKGHGWQVLGLAIDGPTPVREFLAKVPVHIDIGLAGFGGTELAQALGNTAGGLPFTVVISADGRIVQRKLGGTHYDELMQWAQRP